ncbi:MAG: Fic family protein [Gammaproteobacteria bacterium]|nr:Fic family protein [Gammaproteobacteria bacterium]
MKEEIYKIYSPFKLSDGDMKLLEDPEILDAFNKANENYLHWEELRYKTWIPKKFATESAKEVFWSLLRIKRAIDSTITPIRDKNGACFKVNARNYNEFLHIADKELAGNFMGIAPLSEASKKQFISRNLIEESIASSQLEGANTSRAVAKKMLLEGRKPNNHSEQMIVNNYQAMLKIEQELCNKDLSFELICELHSIITDKTLAEDKKGKLRETFDKHGERLKVIPWLNEVTYVAPDKEFVEAELPKLIDFANDKNTNNAEFIHPIIKAIMLHFWIGLLHPFEDGNGRLARTLFYWYMLKHGYWAFKYLSLSEKIKKSSKQYSMAYIYSEQESHDLTYFIQYNIEKLKIARKDFQEYIEKKLKENISTVQINQEKYHLNERQTKLLHYLHQETENRTNIAAYQLSYVVKKGTAIADLKKLVEKKFLRKKKLGRNTFYYPTQAIHELFES